MNRIVARLVSLLPSLRQSARRHVPELLRLEDRELLTAVPGVDPGKYQTISQTLAFGTTPAGGSVSETIQGFNPAIGTLTEIDVINSGMVSGGAAGTLTLTGPSVASTTGVNPGAGGSQTTSLTAEGELAPYLAQRWVTLTESASGAPVSATAEVVFHYVPASVMPPANPIAAPIDIATPPVPATPYSPLLGANSYTPPAPVTPYSPPTAAIPAGSLSAVTPPSVTATDPSVSAPVDTSAPQPAPFSVSPAFVAAVNSLYHNAHSKHPSHVATGHQATHQVVSAAHGTKTAHVHANHAIVWFH